MEPRQSSVYVSRRPSLSASSAARKAPTTAPTDSAIWVYSFAFVTLVAAFDKSLAQRAAHCSEPPLRRIAIAEEGAVRESRAEQKHPKGGTPLGRRDLPRRELPW